MNSRLAALACHRLEAVTESGRAAVAIATCPAPLGACTRGVWTVSGMWLLCGCHGALVHCKRKKRTCGKDQALSPFQCRSALLKSNYV